MKRFSVLAIHRRAGKTVFAVNNMIDNCLRSQLLNPHGHYVAPYYKMAKNIAWDYLKEYTRNIPYVRALESELLVTIQVRDDSIIRLQLYGADNPDSLRGSYIDDLVLDEYSLHPPNIFDEVLRPNLTDRKGSCLFLGTPKGKNQFHAVYRHAEARMRLGDPEWFCATMTPELTGALDPQELEEARRSMPDSKFRQEFLCDWQAGIQGAYYADEMARVREEGRICRVPHEPQLPVFVSFDLGLHDFCALWFYQFYRGEVRCIRYEQFFDTPLEKVLKRIRELPYIYAELFMPWDIEVRDNFTGVSRLESVEAMGFSVTKASKKVSKEDGIHAVRMFLARCIFDAEHCALGIDCLDNFRKKLDVSTGQFLSSEVKDEFVHGADSMRYGAVCYDDNFGNARLDMSRKYANNGMAAGKVIRSV